MTDEVKLMDPPDEGDKKPEKQYTQAEVDRLLKIQKDKIKPLSEKIEELEKGKDETLTAYEARINSMVDSMSKEIHPSILKLLKKLTPLEQLDYLSDPENNAAFEKKAFPLMPKKAEGKPEFKPHALDNPF